MKLYVQKNENGERYFTSGGEQFYTMPTNNGHPRHVGEVVEISGTQYNVYHECTVINGAIRKIGIGMCVHDSNFDFIEM
ncbi:MAG: hypothetical protein RIT35_742 [Pseudomonadota bacterium]